MREANIQSLEWWTCREVGNRYRVDESTVRRWCETGKIRAAKTPGGVWRIHVDEVHGIGARGLPKPAAPTRDDPEFTAATDYFPDDAKPKARV